MAAQADGSSISVVLKELSRHVTGCAEDEVLPYYQHAIKVISMHFDIPTNCNEYDISEKIKRHLARHNKEKEAVQFTDSYRRLQVNKTIRQKGSILALLYCLKDSNATENNLPSSQMFGHTLNLFTSTPIGTETRYLSSHMVVEPPNSLSGCTLPQSISASSGFSSIPSGHLSPDPHYKRIGGDQTEVGSMVKSHSYPTAMASSHSTALESSHYSAKSQRTFLRIPSLEQRILIDKGDSLPYEITESELLKDLVYVFQGIEGKWIKFDPFNDAYRIPSLSGIPKAIRQRVHTLTECGWLYNKIKNYLESCSQLKAVGLVEQSFCAALHQELTEYYRLIAVLESQLHQEEQGIVGEYGHLTLCRTMVWTADPLVRLKVLAALVDICKDERGGALASTIYSCMQHGDPYVKEMHKHILNMVVHPIYVTLLRWIYDGDLENDPMGEFFVACDPKSGVDIWRSKFMLRTAMIPSFISTEQAEKILNAGKSIKFLHHVCHDRTPTKGQQAVQEIDVKQAESMFTQNTNSSFQQMIDRVYVETSLRLLDCIHTKYKFMDHLKALRRYLLFGQGDFITHLMTLLQKELAKPANTLYPHNLTGILEAAIRATNAQFDDSDILDRLDVQMMETSFGDTGWDVFSLYYHVDGPIKTVFDEECVLMYLRTFNFLWRAKRMDYILATVWKALILNAKSYRQLPELNGVLHLCHILCSKMVQFISQFQYYINFEVLECSWDKLVTEVKKSNDLNDIIQAHGSFLVEITTGCLLDEESYDISKQLRAIFDLIIQFQSNLDNLYKCANLELDNRQQYRQMKKEKTKQGQWGLTSSDEASETSRRHNFCEKIASMKAEFLVVSNTYQNMVQMFLNLLELSKFDMDHKLQYLCYRLDFNEHYKKISSGKAYEQHISGFSYLSKGTTADYKKPTISNGSTKLPK